MLATRFPSRPTRRLHRALRVTAIIACVGCSSAPKSPAPYSASGPPKGGVPSQAACPQFVAARGGICEDERLNETSGVAAATVLPGAFWAHNDSGDEARLFLVGRDGAVHGQVALEGIEAFDWEDMGAAPGRQQSPRDLLIGDIGDNFRNRETIQLYRLTEPRLEQLGERVPAQRFDVRLPDGPDDIEALFVDPLDGAVYLASKSLIGAGTLYRVKLPDGGPAAGSVLVADAVGSVPMRLITAADMSSDGSRLVVRNYASALVWERPAGVSIAALLQQPGCELKLPKEPQGESIAFADPHTLLLLSEKSSQPVFVLSENAREGVSLR